MGITSLIVSPSVLKLFATTLLLCIPGDRRKVNASGIPVFYQGNCQFWVIFSVRMTRRKYWNDGVVE